ncbi:relaxin-3-like [Eptesicus fuscus]|uniref:relaxin-3-like n=1 Tax=Eptesicus fuscus TaxID=29078 RepID=UPI00240470EA|nr:relaxin-3-like [Eptesicus fuscus]
MAKHSLPLLLAVWVLAGGLWLEAEARKAPNGSLMQLCHWKFVQAIFLTCGGPRWRRSDNLAQEAMGDAFPDTDPYADSQLEEAVGSSDWLVLTKPPQALYGGQPSWQGTPGSLRGSRDVLAALESCCESECSKSEISRLC